MSQAGPIDVIGGNPTIPTEFVTDDGTAVPILNVLEILGTSVANGTTPVETTGSGNTVTVEVQRSAAIAATDATRVGLAAFDSAAFAVDGNGFVTLAGGGLAVDSVGTQTGTNPIVPTAGGLITINGAVVAAGTNPVRSDGTGANTMAIEVQISQALAATDATKIGLANFDSAAFDVDANGFVQLNGGGIASTSFDVQAATAPGTDPVVPTAAGVVTVNGAAVANHSVVLETRSRAANAYNVEVQYSAAAAATDATKSGVAHFDSAAFAVDANGFVTLAGGGEAIDSFIPDSGTSPVVPAANGSVSVVGSGSTTTVGGLNSLTVQLTGLTNHAILVGAGTTTITKVGPSATAGQVFQSAGAAADPVFSTATYPAIATGTGTLLRADGTNWVATTSTYPNTNAVSTLLYASSANVMAALATANNSILSTDASGVPSLGTSLLNDYTFTSATAGATRTLTVSNTDNSNTASTAVIIAKTGGASSGDAVHQASTTTTTWTWGVDNSVTSPTADPFVIAQGTALGTNNIMSVATSGEINYPLQPAFLAYLASDVTNKTGDGTGYNVVYDTEVFDQNGDFASPTFTAPVTGKYHFNTCTKTEGLAAQTQGFQSIGTSNREFRNFQVSPATVKNDQNEIGFMTNCLADMDAGDTAVSTITVVGGAKTTGVGGSSVVLSFFSGFLAV